MTGAPTWTTGTSQGVASGATAVLNKPAGLVNGMVLMFAIRAQGTVPLNGDFSMPSGFFRGVTPQGSADRAQGFVLKLITDAANEPATYTFGNFSSGRSIATPILVSGVDPANIVGGGIAYSTTDLAARVAEDVPYTEFVMWGDERTVGRSMEPSTKPAGYTEVANVQSTLTAATDTAGSRTAIWIGAKKVEEGGSVNLAATALVWPTGVSANRSNSVILMGTKAPVVVPSSKFRDGIGRNRVLSYKDGAGVIKTPSFVNIWFPGFKNRSAFLAKTGATAAHRGGSLLYPEYSQYGYDHSVMDGHGVLEFSCGWSSDLVPFGLGDSTLDRTTGTSGNVDPNTLTWAAINAGYQNRLRPISAGVYQPLYKLEDFLAKYSKDYTVLVDPKFGFDTAAKLTKMLDLCDAYGGKDNIIIKFDSPTLGTNLNNAAHARQYLTMNYWGGSANSSLMASQQGPWDIIGALYSDAAMLAQANTYGKPVWAAVSPDQAGYNSAVANGADFVMCANPKIAPVSVWN